MRWVLIAVIVILVLFLVISYVAFLFAIKRPKSKKPETEERYIKREQIRKKNNDYLYSLDPEDVSIVSPDGLTLRGWLVTPEKPSNKYVVFVHGYCCNGPDEFSHMLPFYRNTLGFNCLYPDLRAHGRSDGKWIGFGALDYKDIHQWLRYLIDRFGEDIEIVTHGISMGAATTMLVNETNPPEQVKVAIEDCGFTNAFEQIGETLKGMIGFHFKPIVLVCSLMCKLIAGYFFGDSDPEGKMKDEKNPMLFIHGEADDFVPTYMGKRLYEACQQDKDCMWVPGAVHAYSYYDAKEQYEEKVTAFISKYIDLEKTEA